MDKTGSLYFEGGIDVKKLYSTIDQINARIGQMADNAEKQTIKMDSLFDGAIKGATAFLSLNLAKSIGTQIIQVTGQFEQLGVALETILGSKSKADALMAQVVETASTTPFELTDVATGTKQLLAYGFAAEDIIGNIRMLGDVASGVSAPIGDLVYLYGTLRTQGRAYTRDIMQFTARGIPIIRELANVFGIAESEVSKMVEAGKVGFPEVEKAFQNLTKEGGMFYNLMAKQSETITGQLSNLQDNIDKMLNSIGSANSGFIKSGIAGLNELVENYEAVIDTIKVLVVTYGSYKAVVMLVAAGQKALVAAGHIQAWFELAKGIRTAKDAQIAFNLATKANPYALIIAGIGALISYLIIFKDKTDDASGISAEFNKNLSETTSEIKKNFKAITDSESGSKKQADAIQLVNDKYKEYLPNLLSEKSSLEEIKKAQDAVTESMAKSLAFKAQQDDLSKLKTNVDDQFSEFYSKIDKASVKLSDVQKGQFKALIEQYQQQLAEEFKRLGYFPKFIDVEIGNIFSKISGLDFGKGIGGFGISALEFSIKDLIRSEIELDNKTEGLKTTYESYLEALGLTGNSTGPVTDGLKTVQKQIEDTNTAIAEAKMKLAELRAPESTASVSDIEDQEKVIKDLENTLETLTGIKKKSGKEIDSIKDSIKDLFIKLETANDNDKKIIAEKILELQKELLLREKIADSAVKAIRNESVPGIITPLKQNIFTGGVSLIKEANLEFDKLNKKIDEARKKAAKMQGVLTTEEQQEAFEKFLNNTQESLHYVQMITSEYADQLGLSKEQNKVIEDGLQALSGIADLASGNYIQGGAKIISSFLKYVLPEQEKLSEYFKSVADEIDKISKSIDVASESLANLNIDNSFTSIKILKAQMSGLADDAKKLNEELKNSYYGPRRESYTTILKNIVNEKADLEAEIEKLSNRLLAGGLSDDQRDAILAVLESYNSILAQIDDSISNLIGTSVNDLNQSLIDVFFNAEDAATAWGDKVNNVIQNIIKKQLISKLLTDPVNAAINELINDYSDNNLSIEELAKFKDSMSDIYNTASPLIEEVIASLKNLGIDLSSTESTTTSSGLTGAIQRSLTEETGGELAGLMRKTSDDTRQLKDYGKLAVENLVKIEENTANTVNELKNTVSELKTSNEKLEKIINNTTQSTTGRDLGIG